MRLNSTHKPLIFAATVPINADFTLQNSNLSKFCENLRSNYDVKNYVWVREYQDNGRPHYHFVADAPFIDARKLSLYWSGLFCTDRINSIRMGTNPKRPPVRYFVNSPTMARYLTKYMGKELGTHEEGKRRGIRTFGHSVECWKKSQPVKYEATFNRKFVTMTSPYGEDVDMLENISRTFTLCEDAEQNLIEVYGKVPDELREFDDSQYTWFKPNPLHEVWYGLPRSWKRSTGKKRQTAA